MLRQQFEHQHVANSIENERFELKNASNTLETAASSSKMLLIPPKCCKFYGKWEVPTPKCCKDSWNGSFQLQNAANSKENGQKSRSKKIPKRKNKNPKQFRTLYLLPPNKFRTHLDLDFAVCWGLASAGSPEWSASHWCRQVSQERLAMNCQIPDLYSQRNHSIFFWSTFFSVWHVPIPNCSRHRPGSS